MRIKFLVVLCSLAVISLNAFAEPTRPKAPYVLPQEAREWLNKGEPVNFIDVRAKKEYKAGHIEGAINIPYDKMEKHRRKIKEDRPNIFYCIYSAWRAPYAANTMMDLGYKNIYVLQGGISAWNAGGQVIYASLPDQKPEVMLVHPHGEHLQHPPYRKYTQPVDMTIEELSHYDGQDGRPAYVAVNGVIYDLTESRLWRGGVHDPSQGKATAGRDLTDVLKESPHGDKHLKDFPIVGHLK